MSTAIPTAPQALRELGHVVALTRNEAAVHEKHEKEVHPAENLERR